MSARVLRLVRSFSSQAFFVALEDLSMLVNLVFFTKCGILATLTGAAEIADHASIWCEKQHFPLLSGGSHGISWT